MSLVRRGLMVPSWLLSPPGGLAWPSHRLLGVASAVAVVAVGLVVASPLLMLGPPLAVLGRWHWRRLAGRAQGHIAVGDDTIELVRNLIQQLKGGRSLAQAVSSTVIDGPTTTIPASLPPLVRLRAALSAGTGLEAAVARAAGWVPTADTGLGLTFTTLLVLVRRGGPALPALEQLDDTLRSARAVEAEVRAQAAQATASALALAGLPAVFALLVAALDRDVGQFYVHEALGACCLLGAGLLSYLGWWWMHQLIWRAQ